MSAAEPLAPPPSSNLAEIESPSGRIDGSEVCLPRISVSPSAPIRRSTVEAFRSGNVTPPPPHSDLRHQHIPFGNSLQPTLARKEDVKPEVQPQDQAWVTDASIETFRRQFYKGWLGDRKVEKGDPYGFSSAGASTQISRTNSPKPPTHGPVGNYELARRNSLGLG